MRTWNRLSRKAVAQRHQSCRSLEVFKAMIDKQPVLVEGMSAHGRYPCRWQRVWNYMIFKVPFITNHSVILRNLKHRLSLQKLPLKISSMNCDCCNKLVIYAIPVMNNIVLHKDNNRQYIVYIFFPEIES